MKPLTKAAVQGAVCGLMFGTVVLIGGRVWRPAMASAQAPSVADVVRARSFEVVGAAGKQRAVLGVLSDGRVGLGLFDTAGKPRVSLSVSLNGPILLLLDAEGKPRVGLSVAADGPHVVLQDAAGKPRASLSLDGDGPTLRLYDAAGKTRAGLNAFSGGAGLVLLDAAEEMRAGLGVLPNGNPGLAMLDAAGKQRATLGLVSDGRPNLILFDAVGKTRATLGTASLEGVKTGEERSLPESSLIFFDKDGKLIWQAP